MAHYLLFDPARTPKPGDPNGCTWMGFPVVCGPMGLPPETVSLYHNDGHGHFTDVTERAGLSTARAAGLTVLTGDFENNGWPDVFVAADSTPSLFFRNMHDGTFKESGVLVGLAYNEDGHEQSGMGASAADYDHDGWLDIVKTNFSGDIPNLYRNLGKVGFTEVTAQAGLAVHTQYVQLGHAPSSTSTTTAGRISSSPTATSIPTSTAAASARHSSSRACCIGTAATASSSMFPTTPAPASRLAIPRVAWP